MRVKVAEIYRSCIAVGSVPEHCFAELVSMSPKYIEVFHREGTPVAGFPDGGELFFRGVS